MSRAFVKEDDHDEIPFVAPRAHLPAGVPNYVTPDGLKELHKEKDKLLMEREQITTDNEGEKRVSKVVVNRKLQQLENRIASAKVIDPKSQPEKEVRFGAIVKLEDQADKQVHTYQIVGVDEANISKGKVSFVSPMAKILTNKRKGQKATLKLPQIERVFKILEITYE